MNDPVDEKTPGRIDLSDAVTLVVSVVVVLGALGLDAYGVWTLPAELKYGLIAMAASTVFGTTLRGWIKP